MSDEDDKLHLVSHFSGRLRVRARKFREQPKIAEAVVKRVSDLPGVLSASASALTGSILIIYDPRTVQVGALVEAVLSASGLPSVVADVAERASETALAWCVMQTSHTADTTLFRATNGQLDLRTLVPGALFVSGVATLLLKSFERPPWFNLIYWSYVTFNNMHLARRVAIPDAQ
jgi:hypothetical protein